MSGSYCHLTLRVWHWFEQASMKYHGQGEETVVMATKLSSGPMVAENMAPKSTEGRHKRDRKRHAAYAHHRKSAVELLEASKAEYVKSSRVLNNKQELKHPEQLCIQTRDITSASPLSNTLLDEIAYLQSVESEKPKSTETKSDSLRKDSISSGSEKQLSSTSEVKSPVKECSNDVPPLIPERKHSESKTEETVICKAEVKLEVSNKKPDQPPPKPERTFDYDRNEEAPPPKPERKPRSPPTRDEKSVIDTEHSKPNIPPKPGVPPKPCATKPAIPPRTLTAENSPPKPNGASKPVVPPRTVNTESNKFTFPKPKTPSKTTDKPVPPPRPDKVIDRSIKDIQQGVQNSEMSKVEKSDNERKDSISNKSTNSSSQDQQTKRFSSLSAGAALTLSKDQCDGDAFSKGRSPVSAVRSKDSRHSAHSDNFLKPLCATTSLSTSVGFLVEKKHLPVPQPKTEKLSKEKTKDVVQKRHIHRSHSDLSSCRHSRTSSDFSDLSSRISRTSTEVERFFSEMGIDRTVLDPMFRLHEHARDNLDSFSSLDSQEARSVSSRISYGGDLDQVPAESEQDLMERSTTGTSVVERNARIIKWLCNVRKAKNPNAESTSKQHKVANV